MRRFSLFFFIAVFYTANLFAATPSISRTIPTKNQQQPVEQKSETVQTKNRSAANISRVVSRGKNVEAASRDNQQSKVVSRSVNTRTKNSGASLEAAVNTVGRSARTEAASINNTAALRRAGITLRASTAEVGGRATIGNSDVQTGSNIDEQIRGIQNRALTKQKTVTAESLSAAKDLLEKTSDLNSVCQQQYNECMDQFCAVVDANQKRCSCSSNLAKYAKAQEAVEAANTELNDVAQQIRYVGLSADEIRAIMSATEAEIEMGKTKDNTKTRSMLDDIADMIKDPTASTTLTASGSDSLLDMDFDFSSDSSDLFNLDLFGSQSNDISSKRGTALYREATKRCKSVLNQCKDAGGTESQISGNYDLAIAKDCVAYEQGLEKLNATLVNNVRSANLMLQKARLAVLQNKNEYDAKECIGALEKCMLDDMVCGEDYLKCLDPTKRYIDENGEVVLGTNIANITDFMTNYNNTKINADFIKASSSDTTCPNKDGACIVNYLMQKIGTGASVKDGGLCRAVLDKCQYYTYEDNGKKSTYKPYNDVVVGYVQRAMVNIKAAQSRIISEYASTCMNDVQDCYNQQNTQITSWSSDANIDNVYRVLTGTCYNVALTCGYAVFAYDKEMGAKVESLYDEKDRRLALINGISELFYQTMLCPENSVYSDGSLVGGHVNPKCVCKSGYVAYNGTCVVSCPTNYSRWVNECVLNCPDGTKKSDGVCVLKCPSGTKESKGECVLTCPSGTRDDNGVCVANSDSTSSSSSSSTADIASQSSHGYDIETSKDLCWTKLSRDDGPVPTSDNASNECSSERYTWSITNKFSMTLKGKSICSTISGGSALAQGYPTESLNGKYCWCQPTEITAKGTASQNISSPAYYLQITNGENEKPKIYDNKDCHAFCPYWCTSFGGEIIKKQ